MPTHLLAPSLHLFLKCGDNESIVVTLPPQHPLEDVRHVAAALMQSAPWRVRLCWGITNPDYTRAVGEQLPPWATVEATIGLRGGMPKSKARSSFAP